VTFSLRAVLFALITGAGAGLLLCLTLRPSPPDAEIQQLRERAAWALGQAKAWHRVASERQTVIDTQVVVRTRRDTVVRAETDTLLLELVRERPDCAPVVAACERRLAIERANADDWKQLLGDQRQVAQNFKTSADSAIAAADSLQKALDLATRPPSFWRALVKPELRPTAGVGYCWPLNGNPGPCANVGLSLVWRF
jgi:hypothetical protein